MSVNVLLCLLKGLKYLFLNMYIQISVLLQILFCTEYATHCYCITPYTFLLQNMLACLAWGWPTAFCCNIMSRLSIQFTWLYMHVHKWETRDVCACRSNCDYLTGCSSRRSIMYDVLLGYPHNVLHALIVMVAVCRFCDNWKHKRHS